ncbi:MAG: hypothetical protein KDJ16_18475 [Hyphomicrobiales bacterium]|nr:hypothetical protein [Hyphomicrobiales bacterium]
MIGFKHCLIVATVFTGIAGGTSPVPAVEAAVEQSACTPTRACKTAYRWTRQPEKIEKCRGTGPTRACRWTIEYRRTKVPYQICRTRQRCESESALKNVPKQN